MLAKLSQFSELHDASSKRWTQLSSFTALVFLLLTQNCEGGVQVVGPSQPVKATVGDDVLLSCRLEPAADASDMSVEWSRENLDPTFVFVWWDGEELESSKHPSYKGRTSLLVNKLELGEVSLKLSKVKPSDEGTYRCFIPRLGRESTVELVVDDILSRYTSSIIGLAVSLAAAIILLVVVFVRRRRQMRTMKTLYDNINNRLQQENGTLKSRLKELFWEKVKWAETKGKLHEVIQNMNQELEKKLQDENQEWTETEKNLKTELQNMIQELKLTGPIALEEVHRQGFYIRLKNISTEEIKLEGWKLKVQINNREPDKYTFDESHRLQAGGILCLRRPHCSSKRPADVDLVWWDLKSWRPGDQLRIFIISNEESYRLL